VKKIHKDFFKYSKLKHYILLTILYIIIFTLFVLFFKLLNNDTFVSTVTML